MRLPRCAHRRYDICNAIIRLFIVCPLQRAFLATRQQKSKQSEVERWLKFEGTPPPTGTITLPGRIHSLLPPLRAHSCQIDNELQPPPAAGAGALEGTRALIGSSAHVGARRQLFSPRRGAHLGQREHRFHSPVGPGPPGARVLTKQGSLPTPLGAGLAKVRGPLKLAASPPLLRVPKKQSRTPTEAGAVS